MAFDRPIEADRVDDIGLFGSLLRAPVVGIMWLLGGEHGEDTNEESKQKQENEGLERELSGESGGDNGGDGEEENNSVDESPNICHDGGKADTNNDDDPPGDSLSAVSSQPVDQAEVKCQDKENEEPSSLQNWPSVDFSDPPYDDASNIKNKLHDIAVKSSTASSCSSGQSPQRENQSSGMDCPATQIIDDLVTVMESSHIINDSPESSGPASAVLSQSKMASSSTNSLCASYSASTFSNHHDASQNLPLQSNANNNSVHHSLASTNLRGSLRSSKKMSWSDECGNRSLVEYFDDSAAPRSNHWSAMRRNRASRRSSFDMGDKTSGRGRGDVRVIKSALKRSGSYSPPVSFHAINSRGETASTSSSGDSSCASSSSSPEMRSFRSLSVIGSSDSSRSDSSDHVSKESTHSQDTSDSMDAVTNKKLNSNDVQCVPSTLQMGCGRASGGLIIPRGGPADARYYFPRGGPNDPRYQVILGAGAHGQEPKKPSEQGEQNVTKVDKNEEKDESNEKVVGSPNPATAFAGGGWSSPGHHHHFLPRHHTNGYISPQYGFYVNITPPTPELYATRNPLKSGDKPPGAAVHQQSYQQFQYQSKYQAPSPIPEGAPGTPQGIPQRFVGRSSVPRPSSKVAPEEQVHEMPGARKNSLKPTFTKNKKGMGMLLAENPHHGVWPTVPFG